MDILTYTFVQYAFIAGSSAAILAGTLGPMVVSSRQSVASDMLAHVALAGVGLAAVFDIMPLLGAFIVLVTSALLLWWMTTKESYATDALSMLFLSGGLAIALAAIHLARNQTISLETYLFGSILTVTQTELLLMVSFTIATLLIVTVLWYPLLSIVQSPSYRIPYSSRPQYIQLVFFVLLGLTVWVGLKTIGGLLIGALLVIPTLTVKNYVHSFRSLTMLSVCIALISTYIGLFASLFVDVPPSSMIILMLILVFSITSVTHQLLRKV
jgi:zinc transport system permease protein